MQASDAGVWGSDWEKTTARSKAWRPDGTDAHGQVLPQIKIINVEWQPKIYSFCYMLIRKRYWLDSTIV
jgi:hypothetical protein